MTNTRKTLQFTLEAHAVLDTLDREANDWIIFEETARRVCANPYLTGSVPIGRVPMHRQITVMSLRIEYIVMPDLLVITHIIKERDT